MYRHIQGDVEQHLFRKKLIIEILYSITQLNHLQMAKLDLRQRLTDNPEYKAFKFPGGELHFLIQRPNLLYTGTNKIEIIKGELRGKGRKIMEE